MSTTPKARGRSKAASGGRAPLTPHSEVRKNLLRDPEFRLHYEELKFRRQIAQALTEARKRAGMTQAELAELVGTAQPAIARLESGSGGVPSLPFLARVARALGLRVTLTLEADQAA